MKFIHTATDTWHRVSGEDGPDPHPRAGAGRLLSWAHWHAVRDTWPAGGAVGVVLPNTVDVEDLAADLPRLALVALQFPKWVDGRAYSQAHVLRARLRYTGELRAVGDVLVDMLPLLQRTGFDAVELRHDQQESSARRALSLVTDHYQGGLTEPRPLFARQAA